jgi:hypothetical protein
MHYLGNRTDKRHKVRNQVELLYIQKGIWFVDLYVIFQQIIKSINLDSSYMWTMNTFKKNVIYGSLVQNAISYLIT